MKDDEAKAAFWAAVRDPSEGSTEVAQDIALEHGWKLWQLGEEFVSQRLSGAHMPFAVANLNLHFEDDNFTMSHGAFYMTKEVGIEWSVDERKNGDLIVAMFESYHGLKHSYRLIAPTSTTDHGRRPRYRIGDVTRNWPSIEVARSNAAREAWRVLALLKRGYRERWTEKVMEDRWELGPDRVPPELNPARTDPRAAFWAAVADPDPSSIEVAQDIALEHGWKIWQLGHHFSFKAPEDRDTNFVRWLIETHLVGGVSKPRARLFYRYRGERWSRSLEDYRGNREALIQHASEEAWFALRVMKEAYVVYADAGRVAYVIAAGNDQRTPPELNPMRNNPDDDDLAAARDKYKEFHRYDPKSEGSFPSSFRIPARLLHAGKAKWVTYRSSKVDPATLKKPKRPVDYIHEHDAGVETYIKDPRPDTNVPEKFRDVGALVKLGECLGFCVVGSDGDEIEAEGRAPLPELYSTPDGKCLFVIQDKREVLAMSWGGALGVFARGIDG